MALSCFVDTFNITTGIAGSTVVRTGYGFQPKACIYWWSGRTESAATYSRKDLQAGFGVATSPTSRACITGSSDDAALDMNTTRRHSNAACIESLNTIDALDGSADLQSFDATGQTLVIDDSFFSSLRIHCLALGGSDLTDATVVQFRAPSTTGAQTQDITTVGFEPTALLFLSAGSATTPPGIEGTHMLCMGMAVSASLQGVKAWFDGDVNASGLVGNYAYSGECLAFQDARTTTNFRAAFDSFLSNGFRLSWLEVANTTQPYIYALALRGGSATVGNFSTSGTLNATMAESGFGFAPTGVLLFGHSAAQSTQDTPVVAGQWGIGGFTSPTNRACQAVASNNAATTSICGSAVREDACLVLMTNGSSASGVVDVQTVDSDGFTAIMDTADGALRYVQYLAFGNGAAAPAGKAPPPPRQPWRFVRRAA